MELERQVVSLELAKRLKELGMKQKSLFQWIWGREDGDEPDDDSSNKWVLDRHDGAWGMFLCKATCSAFTVAELGEMLPNGMMDKRTYGEDWYCYIENPNVVGQAILGSLCKTEADARAQMLIYLLENNLIQRQGIK